VWFGSGRLVGSGAGAAAAGSRRVVGWRGGGGCRGFWRSFVVFVWGAVPGFGVDVAAVDPPAGRARVGVARAVYRFVCFA
jgi:hypothetical protein